jgi:hypothetical protein
MKSITVTVDDAVYQAAETEATRRHATVSEVAQEALKAMVSGTAQLPNGEAAEREQRIRLVDLLEQCQIDLTERPNREATYAGRRFH